MSSPDTNRREALAFGLASIAAAALRPSPAAAQGKYPDRTIRMIAPRTAGGVVDVAGRMWADRMKPHLGNIVIENQTGGGGTLGASTVAHALPDGYTLLAGQEANSSSAT